MTVHAESIIPLSQKSVTHQNQYSSAIKIGEQLIVSGQIGADASGAIIADAEAQIVAAFEALGEVLTTAGFGFGDVVELKSYHTEFDTLGLFMTIKARYFVGPTFPAWTILGVHLAAPGAIIEIGAHAFRAEGH